MSAKAYDKKTAAFIGWLMQNIPETLTHEDMDAWINNPAATKKFLADLVPPPKAVGPSTPLFSVIGTTRLEEYAQTLTKLCLMAELFGYRDSGFDSWLPLLQPATGADVISTLVFKRALVPAEAARVLPGVEQTSDIARLGRSIIACGYTMTLVQIEHMVKATERGEKTGMSTKGGMSLCFVEAPNQQHPVLVAQLRRGTSKWDGFIDTFDRSFRWPANARLLARNLDVSRL